MTDRLATLLHGEVETLDLPSAPASEILAAGHRLRRRRTWTQRGVGAAALAVVATAAGVVTLGGGASEKSPASGGTGGTFAYASGDHVFVGTGGTQATMPEFAQTLYYTSAGVLVRTNKDGSSDGGAPFHFELVKDDGTTTKLGVTLGEVTPSVDAAQPYLAWATMSGGHVRVIVHDVTTDRDVATVDVPGTFDWGGWDAPPVSLSGDHVYVAMNDTAQVVNWRTGAVSPSTTVPGSTFPDVQGGRMLRTHGDTTQVIDVTTGKSLLEVPGGVDSLVQLSPDGRFVMVSGNQGAARPTPEDVYDVGTGAKVRIPTSSWGWSSDSSSVFRVEGATMTICSTVKADCHNVPVPSVGTKDFVRYAGFAYES